MDRSLREQRLADAIEGVCEGLAITPSQAQQILDHVEVGWLPASAHSVVDCRAAFEWLRDVATQKDAPELAGIALDEWAALSASVRSSNPF